MMKIVCLYQVSPMSEAAVVAATSSGGKEHAVGMLRFSVGVIWTWLPFQ